MAFSGNEGDRALIAAAQRGESRALDVFVRRHDGWVRHVVYAAVGNPALVDDVAQQVWATVWQQIGTLVDPERWRGWLYRTAKHAAIDAGIKRTRERRRLADFSHARPVASRRDDPALEATVAEQHRRVLEAIRVLPEIYREPFILRHLEEWSYAQIGEAMDLPIDTVETRLVRARRLLRTSLRDLGPTGGPKAR
jgi:RNA polymerase sigma-70 factor (ECF subfamily)